MLNQDLREIVELVPVSKWQAMYFINYIRKINKGDVPQPNTIGKFRGNLGICTKDGFVYSKNGGVIIYPWNFERDYGGTVVFDDHSQIDVNRVFLCLKVNVNESVELCLLMNKLKAKMNLIMTTGLYSHYWSCLP
jgi:hypothetical protein